MAEIVSVHATSHTPVMINFADAVPATDREDIFAAYRTVGQEILDARPDALIVISDDHVHNFFMNNFPAFCIGAAANYPTPVEHWLKVRKQTLRGDSQLGAHLLGEALQNGFDPSFSMDLTLDHGVLTPLHLADITADVAVVPVLVNCVQPPLPPMSRALQWGRFLGQALASYEGCARVSVLATGGISHDIATPRMGLLNEDFDREFLRLLGGDDEALVRYATDHVNEAGNGAEEIRTWLVAHGAAQSFGARFEPIYYKGVANWYTGIGLGRWVSRGVA
ncbi:DODA-type extradiol aromatic ring-opening family dioxygenase [Hydrogenophaga sp. OTU3427]|uniref:DODA-type extradiol aromatic ring-opening family dioxygenase n=1 Tax=Hydrogenophaga sp. OTU3427 TaxID=3043856 RepID=UPI00313CF9A8